MEIKAKIDIEANPQQVWDVLTDFQSYSEWNPFISSAAGKPEVGSRLNLSVCPGDKCFSFKPKITKAEIDLELRWQGHLLVPGLFDGEHYFTIESLQDGRVMLTQGERFKGVLRHIILSMIKSDTVVGFQKMNEALKERVEKAGKH